MYAHTRVPLLVFYIIYKFYSYYSSFRSLNIVVFRASFRGRPLHGTCVTIPDHYTGECITYANIHYCMIPGVVLNKSESVNTEEVSYNKTASFSSFYHWNLDKHVSQDDHINQCMQWTRISNAVRIMPITFNI